MSTGKTAEELKALGNEAFGSKDYRQAIEYYSDAIRLDASNCVYFSNRSACHAGLDEWNKAATDAKECIRLDPTFVKGYYRLVTALIELQDYNAAAATIRQGLSVDANNAQLLKQQRTVQQLKRSAENLAKRQQAQQQQQQNAATASAAMNAAAAAAGGGGGVPTSTGNNSELQELQRQFIQTNRELETVKVNMAHRERERKVSELTKNEVLQMDAAKADQEQPTGYYRSVGKMFLKASREDIVAHLDASMEACQKRENEFKKQSEYLVRQAQSQRQNMEELVKSSTE